MHFTESVDYLIHQAEAIGSKINDDQAERLLSAYNALAKPMLVLPTYDQVAAEAGVSKREVRAIAPIIEDLAKKVNVIALTSTAIPPSSNEVDAELPEGMAALFGQATALIGMLTSSTVKAVQAAKQDGDRRLAEAVEGIARDRAGLEQCARKAEVEATRLSNANAALEKDKKRLIEKVERLGAELAASRDKISLLQEILATRGCTACPKLNVAPDITGEDADASVPNDVRSTVDADINDQIAQPGGAPAPETVISEDADQPEDEDSAVAREGDVEEGGDEDVEELLADIPG